MCIRKWLNLINGFTASLCGHILMEVYGLVADFIQRLLTSLSSHAAGGWIAGKLVVETNPLWPWRHLAAGTIAHAHWLSGEANEFLTLLDMVLHKGTGHCAAF